MAALPAAPASPPCSYRRQAGPLAPPQLSLRCKIDWNRPPSAGVLLQDIYRRSPMKGIVAWLLGVPIFVIILLYLFGIF